MSGRRIAFKQADVLRAVKGARAAGLTVGRVEIDQAGKIVIVSASADGAGDEPDYFAAWRAEKDAREAARRK